MEVSSKAVRVLSIFLFVLGITLAIVLTIFALWPDFEASLFDTTHAGGESLTSLHCPLLITPADNASLRLTLANPLEQPINFLVRANISDGFMTLMRQEEAQATVQPGERVAFAWSVKPEDAVYDRMILARVRVLRTVGLPARQRACGIFVLNVPVLRGNQIIAALLTATLLSLGGGTVLWLKNERPLTKRQGERTRVIGVLTLLLLLTMTASLIGWWGAGLLILMIMVLFLVVIIERLGSLK
jgi:hypothetical protein